MQILAGHDNAQFVTGRFKAINGTYCPLPLTSNCPVEFIDWRRAVYLGDPDVVLVGHRDVGQSGAPHPDPVLRHHSEHGGRLLVGHRDVEVLQGLSQIAYRAVLFPVWIGLIHFSLWLRQCIRQLSHAI